MKKKIGMLTAAMLLSATAAFASAPNNVVDKTDAVEISLYGHVQEGAIVDRVGQIELTLYGKESHGQLTDEIEKVYRAVEEDGTKPTLRTRVDMIQWTYNGKLTGGSIIQRLDSLERGVFGRVSTKPVNARVYDLEQVVIGPDKKIVLQPATIPQSTTFKVVFDAPVSTKESHVGDKIPFTVAEDITDGNLLVVPEGTQGTAVITQLRKAGPFGRAAQLDMSFHGISTVDGTTFDAEQGPEAQTRNQDELKAAGASVAGIAILGPVGLVGGLFVKGKSITYPVGTGVYVQPTETIETYGAGLELATAAPGKTAPIAAEKPVKAETATPAVPAQTEKPAAPAATAPATAAPAAPAAPATTTAPAEPEAPAQPVVVIKKTE